MDKNVGRNHPVGKNVPPHKTYDRTLNGIKSTDSVQILFLQNVSDYLMMVYNNIMAETISILPGDTNFEVNLGNGLSVTNGVPTTARNIVTPRGIMIPEKPYVFTADEFTVLDKMHNPPVNLKDVTVLISHGVRKGGKWQFPDGQPVEETVDTYNDYAVNKGKPPIEFVVVCNERKDDPIIYPGFKEPQKLVFALGDKVHVDHISQVKDDGTIYLSIENEDMFPNLDEFIIKKSIKILA